MYKQKVFYTIIFKSNFEHLWKAETDIEACTFLLHLNRFIAPHLAAQVSTMTEGNGHHMKQKYCHHKLQEHNIKCSLCCLFINACALWHNDDFFALH